MKHTLGNTPKCHDCIWWRDREAGDNCRSDGWCICRNQLRVGINGRKRINIPDREPTARNHSCKWWEDAEDHFTRFEALTRHPESWRSEEEQERIRRILNP